MPEGSPPSGPEQARPRFTLADALTLVRLPLGNGSGVEAEGIRLTLGETWGAEQSRIYAFYVE